MSDKDVRFISYFWNLVATKLKFSMAFHPQTNGQSEVVNRSLGNLLQYLVGEAIGIGIQFFLQPNLHIIALSIGL